MQGINGKCLVSLSCNSEETHNTLKFAHRSKHVEIKASQNKIMDEKSLIKKYQREISFLKQELQQLKRGMMENPCLMPSNQEDLLNLKLQRPDHISGLSAIADSERTASGSPSCSNSSQQKLLFTDLKDGRRKSVRRVMILPLLSPFQKEHRQVTCSVQQSEDVVHHR
ncbi:hypothetical protein Taro_055608 [Colocasia esculenta]|uniref:Kinesin motor domain-containing protein n=1 Tax=Colocasia esculenta TaxID=4460 RepID=A0A843XUS2_COLES|nr:hypothetical protein [Colocasia esculenta]